MIKVFIEISVVKCIWLVWIFWGSFLGICGGFFSVIYYVSDGVKGVVKNIVCVFVCINVLWFVIAFVYVWVLVLKGINNGVSLS